MKITRKQLRRLIREEISTMRRFEPAASSEQGWKSLKGTPIGNATLDPSLRGEFKITADGWKDLERLARAAGETIDAD